ncbi:alpha/beta hydrolase [Mycolicibacterium sp. BiH015]|uniref:alpha/beta hydrolase n=1 Tax=Mycolicibacterium sp. BiH015 TaxID=3018808 RepID=UPI0022E993B8|nr:alpha/beta hydrolase [Mycolicibacterium sp. BiH015]MDA2892566.1 alpha/beta hydrolase [Mycolicibacterium sp. BiH015]
MTRRWTVLLGITAAAAAMTGVLMVSSPSAAAAPAESSTASASTTDDGGDVDASTRPKDEAEPDDSDKVTDTDVDADDGVEADEPRRKKHEAKDDPADDAAVDSDRDDASVGSGSTDASERLDTPVRPDVDADSARTASVRVDEGVEQTPTRAPSLINVVGSVVLNVLVGLIHVVDGPPVLPPNSTVTVRTSSLNLPIGAGRPVQADWYFPEDADESTRLVYLQHGFLASAPMYSYTAARLAERTNAIVVAPSLTSNFFAPDAAWVGGSTMHRAVADLFLGDRAALHESASLAAGYAIDLPTTFVLVGHSAGGSMVTSVAGFMADNGAISDLAGVVMLDGVEPAGSRLVSEALAKLRGDNDRPIYLISSERYFWSRGGDMADKMQLARPDRFNGVGLTGGLHIDYMEGGNRLVQFAQYLVGGFSLSRNIDAAEDITAGWVDDLFSGTTARGIYGKPGDAIAVATPSGTATAVVLPLGEPARPVWPPLLDAFLTAIFDFGGRYLFVYEPLRAVELLPTG